MAGFFEQEVCMKLENKTITGKNIVRLNSESNQEVLEITGADIKGGIALKKEARFIGRLNLNRQD